MKLLKLTATDYLKLRCLAIETGGERVIIGGDNAQGKTSALGILASLLGGKRACPDEPIRRGAKRGEIFGDLGELRITRSFTAGGTRLEVTDGAGAPVRRAQELLDQIAPTVVFDPEAWTEAREAEQVAMLSELVGLDLGPVNARIKTFGKDEKGRAEVVRQLTARADTAEHYPGMPAAAPSVVEIVERRSGAEKTLALRARMTEEMERVGKTIRDLRIREHAALDEIERLRETVDHLTGQVNDHTNHSEALGLDIDLIDPDAAMAAIAEANKEIGGAAEIERKILANKTRKAVYADAAGAETLRRVAADGLATANAERREMLDSVVFPLPGLTLGAERPYYQGVPVSQASGAERLRVGVAVVLAQIAKLRDEQGLDPVEVVCVERGCHLDSANRAIVVEMCEAAGIQLLMEIVGTEGATVVFEDGEIVEEGKNDR